MTKLEILALVLIAFLVIELGLIFLLKRKRHEKIRKEIAKIIKKEKI